MNFPPSPDLFFTFLSKEGDATINHMLGEAIDKKGGNTVMVKKIISQFESVNDESDFYEMLEDKYPKSHNKLFDNTPSQEEEVILDRMFANFEKVKLKMNETFSRKKEYLPLEKIVNDIINEEGNLAEDITDLYEKMMERDASAGISKRKSFISKLKTSLGLTNPKTLRVFRDKIDTYFQSEQKPTIESFFDFEVPNFNYALVEISFEVGKEDIVSTKKERNEGWKEKHKQNTLFLTKIVKIEDIEKEINQIDFASTVKTEKKTLSISKKVDFSIFYEVLVQTDFLEEKRRNIAGKIDESEAGRFSRLDNKYSVGEITYDSIRDYLSILLAGKRRETVKLKDKGTSVLPTKATRMLLFSIDNQNETKFINSIYIKKSNKYRMVPLFQEILAQEQTSIPVSEAIKSLQQNVKLNINQFSPSWIKEQVKGLGASASKTREKKIKLDLRNSNSDAYAKRERDFNSLRIRENLFSENFITFAKDKGYIDSDSVFETIEVDNKKVYLTDNEEIIGKIKRIRSNSRIMTKFEEKYEQDLPVSQRALSFSKVEIPEKYTEPLTKAIVVTLSKLKEGQTLEDFLNINNIDMNKSSPMTLDKATFLSHFLAKRYGGQGTVTKVKNIDSSLKKGLSLDDDTVVQEVADLATSINTGVKNFNAKYLAALKKKLEDITEKPKTYPSLYYSTVLDDLLRLNLIKEED